MNIRTLAAGAASALLALALTAPALGAMADDSAVDTAAETIVETVEDAAIETPAPSVDSVADEASVENAGATSPLVEEPTPDTAPAPAPPATQFGPATPAVIPGGYVHDQVVIVTDDSGNPVLASVALLRPDGSERMRIDTDAQGIAHLMYVAVDNYTLRITPNYAVHGDLQTEWYGDASSFDEAEFFLVHPSLGPLSVVLEADPAAASAVLSGVVIDAATGDPLQIAQVRLALASDPGDTIRLLSTGADGRYSMNALPSEEYRVEFSAPGYTDWGTSITIGSGPATLDAPLSVDPQFGYPYATGMVTDYADRPLRNAQVELYSDVDGSPVVSTTTVSGLYALLFNANGTDPGAYFVRFVAPPLSDLESVWWPGVEDAQDAQAYSFTTPGQHQLSMVLPKEPEPPVAHRDDYSVSQDIALVVPEPSGGLLANDVGEPPLTLEHNYGPSHGQLSLQENGTFTYIPDPGFVGVDYFNYRAIDSLGQKSSGYGGVYIAVGDFTHDTPQAVDDHYSVLVGETLTLDASTGPLANDTGAPILEFGELDDKDDEFRDEVGDYDYDDDGSFSFTPHPGVVGTYSVGYYIVDGYDESAEGTITITVVDPDAPEDPTDAPADDPATDGSHQPGVGGDGLAHTGNGVPVGVIVTGVLTLLAGAWLVSSRRRTSGRAS